MKNDLWEDIIVQTASVFINDHSMTRIEVLVQVLFLGPKVYKSHRWIDARAIHDIVFLSTGVAHNLFFLYESVLPNNEYSTSGNDSFNVIIIIVEQRGARKH